MPQTRRRPSRPARTVVKRRNWRYRFLSVLIGWNRYQVGRVIGGVIAVWLIGAWALYLAEGHTNPAFESFGESLWSVWVLLFSGLEESPKTPVGRVLAMVLLVAGVGLAGLFTASVASLLVERYLRRRDVSNFEMDDHLVLCNWAPRGLEWIREVHSKIITEPRPIVIIHDNPDEIDLPDKQDEPAFNDVYIVKGDPTNEVDSPPSHGGQGLLGRHLERRTRRQARRRQVDPDLHRDPAHLPRRSPAQYRRRVPKPQQPIPSAESRRQRDRLVRLPGAASAGTVGAVSRDDAVLPRAAHGPPRQQRGVPAAGARRTDRPRLRRARRRCS